MSNEAEALNAEIEKCKRLLEFKPINGLESALQEKTKATVRVLEMIAGLRDEVTIGGRVYEQTVDVRALKSQALRAFLTPGRFMSLDEARGLDQS